MCACSLFVLAHPVNNVNRASWNDSNQKFRYIATPPIVVKLHKQLRGDSDDQKLNAVFQSDRRSESAQDSKSAEQELSHQELPQWIAAPLPG